MGGERASSVSIVLIVFSSKTINVIPYYYLCEIKFRADSGQVSIKYDNMYMYDCMCMYFKLLGKPPFIMIVNIKQEINFHKRITPYPANMKWFQLKH